MWIYALGAIAGFVGDRVQRKSLILGGCIFWSFVTVTTGQCTKLWQFVAVRALEGGGETFYFPASVSLMSDYHGRDTRSLRSVVSSIQRLHRHDPGELDRRLARSALRMAVWFLPVRERGRHFVLILYRFLRRAWQGPKRVARRACIGEAAAGVRYTTGDSSLSHCDASHGGVFWGEFRRHGFPDLDADVSGQEVQLSIGGRWPSGTVYIHLASAVSVPLAGMAADRLSRRFAGGRILIQALGLLIGAWFVMTVGHTQSTHVLLAAMTAFGFCKGCYDSGIFASLYDVIEPRSGNRGGYDEHGGLDRRRPGPSGNRLGRDARTSRVKS